MAAAGARLILTRPQAQAEDWCERMSRHGIDCVLLPLIRIAPAVDLQAVERAWQSLPGCALAFFVSPNAVEHFFAARPADQAWPANTLAATVGPGSAAALRRWGVPTEAIRQPPPDADSLDSEHLWPTLAPLPWQGRRVLMLRGDGGREWLAERLRDAGAEVCALSVYRREPPCFDAAQRQLFETALAQPARHVWLFSSAEAIDHLSQLGHSDWSRCLGIATHERIAQRARSLGLAHVVLTRPDAAAVAAAFHQLSG